MKIIREKYSVNCHLTVLIILSLVFISGCQGSMFRATSKNTGTMISEGFEGNPDNCTKCHYAWTKEFDYHRGWDRYGYIFGGDNVVGNYDPWYTSQLSNMFKAYYAGDWWDTPALYPWPDDVAGNIESLCLISRNGGVPEIPHSIEDIKGPVFVVTKQNGKYTSIQKAIDDAVPGATVFVHPGVYNEVLTLKDGINLIGENPYTTIINPLNKGHALTAANNAIIAGFTFTGTGIDYEQGTFNAAIYAAATDSTCIIANNIFRENGLFGVWIDGALDSRGNRIFEKEFNHYEIEIHDRPYMDYPNPVIVGNTFYRIGQRGVFCVHARGEVFNNIFLGNVKAVGLERHSKTIFHHNVCYFNNVPMAINRSEPVVFNNIFLHNQWGQRMLRGANPVMFENVTWESPHFRDFDEAGRPYYYKPYPGTGERNIDPCFINPLGGDFRFSSTSPLYGQTHGFEAVGIMRDSDIPQPLIVQCANSYGREVLSLTENIVELIEKVDIENAKIQNLNASYKITFESYLDLKPDKSGTIKSYTAKPSGQPVIHIEYDVSEFRMEGSLRFKKYSEKGTVNGETYEDSGTVTYNGSHIEATGGRYDGLYETQDDPLFIGEKPFRETPGGLYRDYDQFVKGAIGTLGTFYHGYLRIMGGKIEQNKAVIDGNECIIVRYPHIGKDQYFLFYLDPSVGYRPRKMEQYYNGKLYRRIDSYRYKAFSDDIFLPVQLKITDFVVAKNYRGEIAGQLSLQVREDSIMVNRGNRMSQ
ncbi:MAG: hypothetical protein JXB48_11170 [Candidatus Latescibacteria bacterium]|nr:hypothetical protein [Candidatus Latescibacterota bacterium]